MTKDEKITDWRNQLHDIHYDLFMLGQRETDEQEIKHMEDARKAAKQCFIALGKCRWGGHRSPRNATRNALKR